MQVIVVTNRKGGIGKTTVSVNLAAELANRGYRVLIIDLDTQSHCAIGLGVNVTNNLPTAHDIFVDPSATLSRSVMTTQVKNLSLIPANPRFDHGSGDVDVLRLKKALLQEDMASQFDLVILDTPPSLDHLLMNALHAATKILIPYIPHPLSFAGIKQLIRVLFPVMAKNRDLKFLGFLPNMQSTRVKQHKEITGQVVKEFGLDRILPGIRSDIRLAEAFAKGVPVNRYAPNSRGSADFQQLTDYVVKQCFTHTL